MIINDTNPEKPKDDKLTYLATVWAMFVTDMTVDKAMTCLHRLTDAKVEIFGFTIAKTVEINLKNFLELFALVNTLKGRWETDVFSLYSQWDSMDNTGVIRSDKYLVTLSINLLDGIATMRCDPRAK